VRAVFVGSRYSANRQCMQSILTDLAPRCGAEVEFLVAGSVCASASPASVPDNVRLLGFVKDLPELLRSCDVFLNPTPMTTGINMKVIQALACGLRTISTPEGARGYESLVGGPVRAVPLMEFPDEIRKATPLAPAELEALRPYAWSEVARRRLDLYEAVRAGNA